MITTNPEVLAVCKWTHPTMPVPFNREKSGSVCSGLGKEERYDALTVRKRFADAWLNKIAEDFRQILKELKRADPQ